MRRTLFASTCLAALVAGPIHAETSIATKRTDAVRTSTIASGARDDIKITSAGSIELTAGTGVTIDSVNKVTNEGTIAIPNANNATGILANAGTGGGIVNSGKILIDETYVGTDDDKDGDVDGPFAIGSGRTGIATAGAYAGAILNSGQISIEGNDSFGIRLGGPLTGAFTNDGSIGVLGTRAVGIQAGDITGNVRIAGTVAAAGQDAVAVRLAGDITGALVVQGVVQSTGYRTTTPPADVSKLDADDLLQGGSALVVAGNVSGGIILAVPPKDSSPTDNDEDKDGIDDAKEGSASVISYGAAPAFVIGAADRAVTIGAVAGTATGFGLIIDGAVRGLGTYAGVEANGLRIGGLGGAVSIAGGIGITGVVEAVSKDVSATALRIGSGASTPELRNAGTIAATGGGTAAAKTTAVVIDAGGNLPTLRNSGTIKATAGGVDGTATAIVDRSGTLALVENSGAISASGATATSDRNVAIDLSARNAASIVRQTAVAAGVTAPSIAGDVRFGGGDDLFDIADGTVKGNASFGGGANRLALSGDAVFTGNASFGGGADTVSLAGTSVLEGTLDFGGGADKLTIGGTALFRGSLANSGGLAVSVNGGGLDIAKGASIASLSVAGNGIIGVTLDKSGGTGTLIQVAGAADFATGSKLAVRLVNIADAEGRYIVLRAGTLTGAANIGVIETAVPFIYKGTVSGVGGTELAVDITRKTTTELGLNRSQATAYNAIYAALGSDAKVGSSFLAITAGDDFRSKVRQLLPDHAGGSFEVVTQGSRAVARLLADPKGPFKDEGRWGYWISQSVLGTRKSVDDTAGYSINGWGVSAGGEYKTGVGNFGASLSYLSGQNDDRGTENEVSSNQFELAGYWRGRWGGFSGFARASAARIDFNGSRRFVASIGSETVSRISKGSWNGDLVSATGGVAYEMKSGMFVLRPVASLDYYKLKEDGYAETGGGKAVDLVVDRRSSDELAANGSIVAGLEFDDGHQDSGWMRFEIEAGRRQLIGGALGATTARFDGGQPFTLTPEDRTSGWVGKVRASAGNASFRINGEVNGEEQQGRMALSARASLQIGL